MEGMEDKDIATFKLLLHTFAKMISIPGVHKMKHELKGHLSKDILRQVNTGKDLVGLLYNNGFLNDNKLMFFKKILRNASLHELEDILTEYVARKRESSDFMTEGSKQSVDNRTQNRLDALEKTIQRQFVAINYKQEQLFCENDELSRKSVAFDVINCRLGAEEELLLEILARKKIKEKDLKKYEIHTNDVLVLISENESHRSKLIEEIAVKEAELKNLERDLKKEKDNRKNSIISMVLSETNIEKLSQVITKLRKDILNVAKERERLEYKLQHIETRRERHKDTLRIINLERIAKVKDISEMEKKLIEAKESYLDQARKVGSLELEVMELMHSMEGNEAEAKETKDRGLQCQSEFLMMAFRNINQRIEAKEFHVSMIYLFQSVKCCRNDKNHLGAWSFGNKRKIGVANS
ncbi:structural maintenance of chromosomes protein 2-like [Rhopilema esculentum]|uniref:structural maintenance of chromosomes protein 2-like n=1 Tax=Rhopilema esculentum TaxID=499914 RepID=UPI0031D9221E